PSSMTQLMVLAYPLLAARTRQTTSLFSADSSVPFSVTVTLRSSFLTRWRMTSGRAVGGRVAKYTPADPPPKRRAARTAQATSRPRPLRTFDGRVRGANPLPLAAGIGPGD